jgi:hypothetical protein
LSVLWSTKRWRADYVQGVLEKLINREFAAENLG